MIDGIEVTKLINARPNGVRTTDQDHTDTWRYLTTGFIKFLSPTDKNEFSLVLTLEVASTAGAIIGNTVTGAISLATGVIVGFSSTHLFLNTTTGTFQAAETIDDGAAYNTTITSIVGVGVSGGKTVIRAIRATTNQFSLVPNKEFLAEFEAYWATDPTYQLKHAIKTLDVTGNKKIYIELPEDNINDATLNVDVNGLNISEIKSTTNYPAHPNYVPLYEVTAGDWNNATDTRQQLLLNGEYIDLTNVTDLNVDTLTVNNTTNLNGNTFINGVALNTYIISVAGGALGASSVKDFILGEDFPLTGDNEGAGFLGRRETTINNASAVITVPWGAVAANEKMRFCFDKYSAVKTIDTLTVSGSTGFPANIKIGNTPPPPGGNRVEQGVLITNFGTGKYFEKLTVSIRATTVSVTDYLQCTVYDGVNGNVIASSNNLISGATLGLVYTNKVFDFGIVTIPEATSEVFFRLHRTGVLDNTDFYEWESEDYVDPDSRPWYNTGLWFQDVGTNRFKVDFLDTSILSDNLREFSVFMQKAGAPVDDIDVTVWEDNTQLTPDISGNITNAEVNGTTITKLLQRTWGTGEGRSIYIEFDRVGGVDAVNHYEIKSAATISNGFSYQLWDGVTRTTGTGSPTGGAIFGFTLDRIWLSDNRNEEGDVCDGICLTTGLEGETKTFITAGYRAQTVGTPGNGYYIDSSDGGITLGHYVQNVTPVSGVVRGRLIGEQKTTTEMECYIPESNYQRTGVPGIRVPGLSNVEYSDQSLIVPTTSATLILTYQHTMVRNGGYTISADREFAGLPTQWFTFDAVQLNIGDVIQVYTRETGGNQFFELRINGLAILSTPAVALSNISNFEITFDEIFTYTTTP